MQLKGIVKKGWGSELIWATNDKYCGKLMTFRKGAKFSMHFHAVKDETWLVQSGLFKVIYIDTKDASRHEKWIEIHGIAGGADYKRHAGIKRIEGGSG